MPMKPAGTELAKSAVSLAGSVLAPGVVSAVTLLQKGANALADFVKAHDQRRYEEFCQAAYEGAVFPENGENLTAEELVSMLRACLADLEDEKAALYGQLASAIATGKVPRPYRHPLMISLTAMTYAQADRLRKGYIAAKFPLIPHLGAGRRSATDFLGGDGLVDQWDAEKLTGLSMIKDGDTTKLGQRLVIACFPEGALSPQAIGERAWIDEVPIGMVSYEMSDRAVVMLAEAVGIAAREYGIKVSPLAAPPDQRHADMLRRTLRCFVILVGPDNGPLLAHANLLKPVIDRGYHPIIAFLDRRNTKVCEAFPDAHILEGKGDPSFGQTVVAAVVDVLIAAKQIGNHRKA